MAAYEKVKAHQYENVSLPSNHQYENVLLPGHKDPDPKPMPPAKPPREQLTHLYNEAAKKINVPFLEDYMRNAKEKGYFEMEFKVGKDAYKPLLAPQSPFFRNCQLNENA